MTISVLSFANADGGVCSVGVGGGEGASVSIGEGRGLEAVTCVCIISFTVEAGYDPKRTDQSKWDYTIIYMPAT